jgi:dihydroflavonol-4-reductase
VRERAVLVTGATGFVGAALLRRLCALGADVHALARRSSRRGSASGLPVTWHEADLLEPASVDAAVEAFARAARAADRAPDAVHGAAQLGYATGGAELARRVNVEGTRVVLEACQAHGVRRVVHVSSVVAVGHAPDARSALDEDARYNGAELQVDYVTTKRAAEDFALAVSRQLDVVVVNPGAIFGSGPVPTNTTLFLRRVAEGRVGPVAPPGSISAVGVDDVADGIARALERGRRGARYILAEQNLTLRELLASAARVLGASPPRATAPRGLWRAGCALAVPWDRLHPARDATPQALRMLGAHFRFDARRAREELGWSPRPFAEVLAATVEELRASGVLPASPPRAGRVSS